MPTGKSTKKENEPKKNNTGELKVKRSSILNEEISVEMKKSYLDFAMSTITSRALPDVRDGLKPVQRRILYAMHGMGLHHGSKTRKSAAITGEVLGKYHPHGNIPVYEAMVKIAQDFGTRYPLVIGQGNFGSIDGDPAAAERYTEAKLSKIAEEMLKNIDKETVNFVPNYENTLKEPTVLPAIPLNILLNGVFGIAVGMTSKIPPHNLAEVCDAVIKYIDREDVTIDDLLHNIKGPDFPLGGNAYDKEAIKQIYSTGRGGLLVRGDAEIVENNKNTQIIITSIPYNVNKSDLLSKIGLLVSEKKIEGVKDLRDESTKDIRIAIDLKSNSHPQKILNALYKSTQLENVFHYNMVALCDGVPLTLNLKEIIQYYVQHRRAIVEKRTKFDLARAKEREHILSGLSKALDHIDKIITTIKKSKEVSDARKALMKTFKFTEIQTNAILEMRLQKLAGLERKKVEDELKQIQTTIKDLEAILKSKKKIDNEVKKEVVSLKESYGDKRRTKIVAVTPGKIAEEDLIPNEQCLFIITNSGYVKRTSMDEYRKQKRGGVGMKGSEMKDEDYTILSACGDTHNTVFFLTDKGKIYKLKAYEIPEGKRVNKGKALVNFLSIENDERVTSIIPYDDKQDKNNFFFFITKKGTIKKVATTQFDNIRKSGIIAVSLEKGDQLVSTFIVHKGDNIFITTKKGKSIRFNADDVRVSGRSAKGVRGINLSKDDGVVKSFCVPASKENNYFILTISQKGYAKKTDCKSFKVQKRGGSGIKVAEITEKTGDIAGAHLTYKDSKDEILTISKTGKLVRISIEEIPERGRQTQGVNIMKVKKLDQITSTAYVDK